MQEYRGSNITLMFGLQEALKYIALHPLESLYYLGTFVHPGVFHMFVNFFHEIYPNYKYATPEHIRNLMVDTFNIPPVDKQQLMVRNIGWVTNDDPKVASAWRTDTDPGVKLYIQYNPNYDKGYGLTVLVPLTFKNIILSSVRYFKGRSAHHRPG